jgi:hypothetical protein
MRANQQYASHVLFWFANFGESLEPNPNHGQELQILKYNNYCRASLHKECPQHHGHKGDPGVTPETCGVDDENVVTLASSP